MIHNRPREDKRHARIRDSLRPNPDFKTEYSRALGAAKANTAFANTSNRDSVRFVRFQSASADQRIRLKDLQINTMSYISGATNQLGPRLMRAAEMSGSFDTRRRRPDDGELALTPKIATALAVVASGILATGMIVRSTSGEAQSPTTATEQAPARYLPEYTSSGELLLPKDWRHWVFVGSPLTPNALNNGKANFPEYHNVYIEPGSYAIYEKTGKFPEGTIFFKELQLTLPAENSDGSRTEPSGRGYFPGPFNGADVTVKDTKRYAESGGWGYYNFNHFEPKAKTAKVKLKEECGYCHIANAKKDDVWTQFYPLLDHD